MDRLVETAREFAVEKHGNQKRKYDGAAYIVHLESVAGVLVEHGYKNLSYSQPRYYTTPSRIRMRPFRNCLKGLVKKSRSLSIG